MTSVWEALSHRNFRLLASGQLVSALGDGVALVAVSFALLESTGSISTLGWVLGARYGCLGTFLLLGGVWGDRASRCRILVFSDLSRALAQGMLAAMFLLGHAPFWALIVLQAGYGTAEAFFSPAIRGLIPQTVDRQHLRAANAVGEVTFNAARVIGPALGGLLVIAIGTASAIALDAVSFLVSAALVSRMRVTHVAPTARSSVLVELAEGWNVVLQHRWLWSSILTFTIFGALTIPASWVLGPATSWRGLGGVAGWSALTSAFGAGALVGSFVALQLNPRRPGLVLMAALMVAALRPATFVSGWPLSVIAAYCFIAGAAMAAAGVIWYTLLQSLLPSSVLSRVSAIDDFGTYLLTPIGYFGAAPFAAAVGLTPALVLLAVVPAGACLAAMAVPELRRLDGTVRPPVHPPFEPVPAVAAVPLPAAVG